MNHSVGEYVNKADPSLHTKTVEGFFALLKRSMYGTYHAVSKRHLPRYVQQAAFLYNTRRMSNTERNGSFRRAIDPSASIPTP